MKKSELKEIIRKEIINSLNFNQILKEHIEYFSGMPKSHEDVYKNLQFDYKENLQNVFIYFRGLKKEGKVKFIPTVKSDQWYQRKNQTYEDYNRIHMVDYVDTNTGEVFTIIVDDEDWFESLYYIYPSTKEDLEIMKRENLI